MIFKRWRIKKIAKTVALVTVFSCFERFIGFIYRIYLSRKLGAESLGLYQITLSVVGVLITLTASGIPITVSRLMIKERASKNARGERDVVSAGILSSLIISLPVTLALYFGRNLFSFIFADQRCYDLLLVILPGVVITSVYAVIRGYFWGNSNFFTYAVIELIEEISMCLAGVFIIERTKNESLFAMGAAKSVLISYVVSFVISTTVFVFKSGGLSNPVKKLKPLVVSASPITAMRTLTSCIGSVVAVIIPSRLVKFGLSNAEAIKSFGELSGMTLPLLFIPSTLIGSIALVIVPKLSETFYKNDLATLSQSVERAFKCSMLISCIIIPVFIACGKEIGLLVYDNQNAGEYLTTSAIIMLPMSVTLITNSILNSLNKEKTTLFNFAVSAIAMLLFIWFFTGKIGIYSLIIGYLINYLLTSALNLITLSKITGDLKKYLVSTALFGFSIVPPTVFGVLLKRLFVNFDHVFLTVFVSGTIVFLFSLATLFVLGLLDFSDLFGKNSAQKRSKANPQPSLRLNGKTRT